MSLVDGMAMELEQRKMGLVPPRGLTRNQISPGKRLKIDARGRVRFSAVLIEETVVTLYGKGIRRTRRFRVEVGKTGKVNICRRDTGAFSEETAATGYELEALLDLPGFIETLHGAKQLATRFGR